MRLPTRLLAPAVLTASALVPIAAAPAQADVTTPSLITCVDAHLWGNFDGSHYSNPITLLHSGDRVGWRYQNGDADMVLWYAGGVWGFVQASCVAVGAG